jgi:hypothetical protein
VLAFGILIEPIDYTGNHSVSSTKTTAHHGA